MNVSHYVVIVALASALSAGAATASTSTLLYRFKGGTDGSNPDQELVMGKNGILYGITPNGAPGGVSRIFSLTPPALGKTAWTKQTLHTFTNPAEGTLPRGPLAIDSSGALYGVTQYDGGGSGCLYGCGTIFKLTPPTTAKGSWVLNTLHNFVATDGGGAIPLSAPVLDKNGVLYGTAFYGGLYNNGVVYRLSPPAPKKTAWTKTVLYRFRGGNDGTAPMTLTRSEVDGKLYGSTEVGGVVFMLAPPAAGKTAWTRVIIHRATGGLDDGPPIGQLTVDKSGNLYGALDAGTNKDGTITTETIVKFVPPSPSQTAWTKSVLYSFRETDSSNARRPNGGIIFDKLGNICGTAAWDSIGEKGTVFKLTKPSSTKASWTYTLLHQFKGTDGAMPQAGVISDSTGILYGTTSSDGGYGNTGTIFKVVP